jgi:hypothetical protein
LWAVRQTSCEGKMCLTRLEPTHIAHEAMVLLNK